MEENIRHESEESRSGYINIRLRRAQSRSREGHYRMTQRSSHQTTELENMSIKTQQNWKGKRTNPQSNTPLSTDSVTRKIRRIQNSATASAKRTLSTSTEHATQREQKARLFKCPWKLHQDGPYPGPFKKKEISKTQKPYKKKSQKLKNLKGLK